MQAIVSLPSFAAKDHASRVISVVKDLVANAATKAAVIDDAFRIAASLAEGEAVASRSFVCDTSSPRSSLG